MASAGGFYEGVVARALGQPSSANPYPPRSRENILWDEGWRSPEDKRAAPLSDPSGLGM
jgi:hypothetical protein